MKQAIELNGHEITNEALIAAWMAETDKKLCKMLENDIAHRICDVFESKGWCGNFTYVDEWGNDHFQEGVEIDPGSTSEVCIFVGYCSERESSCEQFEVAEALIGTADMYELLGVVRAPR